MKFELTILGSAAATPAYGRFPSSQVLNIQDNWYMIDCGEGTQMRLTDFHIPRNKIKHIFISHLHGDHIFGLPGLLTSYSLSGRTQPMHIYAPEGLQEWLETTMKISYSYLTFPIEYHILNSLLSEIILDNDILTVTTLPLIHSVPTLGFWFVEKPLLPNFRKEKIAEYQIPLDQILAIKKGADFIRVDGTIVPHDELTVPAPVPRSYAYCSDTMYAEHLIPLLQNIDLLYHEATFVEQFRENAEFGMHSTAKDAAIFAKNINAGMLVLGHFSARFQDSKPAISEAQQYFYNSFAAIDGVTFSIPFRRNS